MTHDLSVVIQAGGEAPGLAYQFVEDEGGDGRPRVLMRPEVGPVDAAELGMR